MSEPPGKDFSSLYRATIAPLRRYLARILRSDNDAQDVAHDAYRRVYTAMDAQRVEKPEAFLYTTARRLAWKQVKRQRNAPVRPGESNVIALAPSASPGVQQIVMARQEWARMEAAIAALPPGCRSVLQLCRIEGLSHAEIGARLGIAISTVEKQHARALRLLRAALHDDAAPSRATNESSEEGGTSAAAR